MRLVELQREKWKRRSAGRRPTYTPTEVMVGLGAIHFVERVLAENPKFRGTVKNTSERTSWFVDGVRVAARERGFEITRRQVETLKQQLDTARGISGRESGIVGRVP